MTTEELERETLAAATVAAEREQAKARAAAQRAAATEASRVAAERPVQARALAEQEERIAAREAQLRDPEFRAGVLRELDEAKAAFERTVIADFAQSGTAYLTWMAAITRADRLGIAESHDYPRFGVWIDLVLYGEAGRRGQAPR